MSGDFRSSQTLSTAAETHPVPGGNTRYCQRNCTSRAGNRSPIKHSYLPQPSAGGCRTLSSIPSSAWNTAARQRPISARVFWLIPNGASRPQVRNCTWWGTALKSPSTEGQSLPGIGRLSTQTICRSRNAWPLTCTFNTEGPELLVVEVQIFVRAHPITGFHCTALAATARHTSRRKVELRLRFGLRLNLWSHHGLSGRYS